MKLNLKISGVILILMVALFAGSCNPLAPKQLIISCNATNDLYVTLLENNVPCLRCDSPGAAADLAKNGAGVMILADGYPGNTTQLDEEFYRKALKKKLRLYIEYPSSIPGIKMPAPRAANLERVVVTSDSVDGLSRSQILSMHGCWFIPLKTSNPLLAIGKVAGFDKAVYGLDDKSEAGSVLFRLEDTGWLISTTKLSGFITTRYAPKSSIRALWSYILKSIEVKDAAVRALDWVPDVRPSYGRDEALAPDAARLAVQKGLDWHRKAGMLLNNDGWIEYKKLWKLNDSNIHTTVPAVDNAAPLPKSAPGDGSLGVLEGIASRIDNEGNQPARWWLRSDSNGESSLAFALRWKMDGDTFSRKVAGNLLDWVYFRSGLFQDDPSKANYGLLLWAPGNAQALYQDNDVKVILGCIGTSAVFETDRWNEVLAKNILGNFRTTGVNGFRGWRIENPELLQKGWRSYNSRDVIQLQPHYEAWTWASYLWLYDKTGWKPLLEQTRKGIAMMMKSYPSGWRWTNGIQQERGRMLLPLAWLIRVDDQPEYRAWLKTLADDIERCQDSSGAIREELGEPGRGDMAPPSSNEDYGKGEAPLIQQNGDAVADLLYTCNFTFTGLNEAYAATGEEQYKRMADKLAGFLVRIQIRSDKHPYLDGGWYRAFDFNHWEYLGSNADSGWGAWSIETGWTQAWIPSVLAMREMKLNLWDLSKTSKIGSGFDKIRKQMLPS